MHIADVTITNEWVKLTDLIQQSIQEDITYTIMNSSPYRLYAIEASEEPTKDIVGVFVDEGGTIVYKKGTQELYLKNIRAGKDVESYACVNVEG